MRAKLLGGVFLLLASCFTGLTAAAPQGKADLTVSAAVSLKDALDEISPQFTAAQPSIALQFNLGASGTLQRQIEQGAPVDVYISAAPEQMDALAAKGLLLADTRHDLVRNSLVLIVPARSSIKISSFPGLAAAAVKVIAIGEPQTVPAGKYAQEVLTRFSLYDSLKPKFVLAKDVRQVLTYVASGNADAGIVYATDAKTSADVRVAAVAPENSHQPIVYPVAVLKDSKNTAAARSFVEFLLSSKAQAIFQKYGFSPAK